MNKERRDTHLKFTEQQISKMASPISQTEEEKCKNAIRMVRDEMCIRDRDTAYGN